MRTLVFKERGRPKPWGVKYTVEGKRVRKFFATKAEAEERRIKLDAAFASGGLVAVDALDQPEWVAEVERIAADNGKTVLELVRLGARMSKKAIDNVTGPTLREAFNAFEARNAEVRLRPATAEFYRAQLECFLRTVSDGLRTNQLDRAMVRRWIDSRPIPSRPHALRAVRAWFRWMLRQEPPMIESEPIAGVTLEASLERDAVVFLTAKEARKLLAVCSLLIQPAVALMLFAGIRHNELHRDPIADGVDVLRWEDINLKEKTITVRAEVAKTRVARTMRGLPSNLWTWLPKDKKGVICAGHLRAGLDSARKATGCRWAKSILRHTFASHHVAAFGDLSATALILRHETGIALLNQRYREGVALSKAAGRAYFGILPN